MINELGESIAFTALTPKTQQISAANAVNTIAFPLSISANTFSAGTEYSFRLTVQRVGNTITNRQTFTEIMLTVNSVPDGGLVSSIPASGTALETSFGISTSGWATAAENFPLSYAFAYRISTTSSLFTIAALSLSAFVETELPAGDNRNLVTLQGQAMDVFLSSSLATSTVTVKKSENLNITRFLSINVAGGFDTGNVNKVFQAINNVSY
jgi:hypothetical protein